MRFWNRIKHSLAALGLAAAALGTSAAAEAKAAKPAMWQVSDRDTSIYLFGTVHLLPPGTQWRPRPGKPRQAQPGRPESCPKCAFNTSCHQLRSTSM